ncbi:MAG: hypothetical protein H7X99_09160 [Saprospiraceae bacterium]|nr:hypothetical protein [Saprospiraceae bacterium]
MSRDINTLRTDIKVLKDKLIPFNEDEMELLSLRQSFSSRKKGITKISKGVFDTIYFEHLLAYAIRTYSNGQKLILITTTSDEFIYFNKGNKTHVFVNNAEAGMLSPEGKLYDVRNKLLATIDGGDQRLSHPVWIKGKEVGYIANPRFNTKTMQRAFQFVQPMSKDERSIFLCLTLVNLVEEAQ